METLLNALGDDVEVTHEPKHITAVGARSSSCHPFFALSRQDNDRDVANSHLLMPFTQYLKELRKHLRLGDATEHTHRPALKTLMEQTGEGITATNEPKHITDVGAPDFIVRRSGLPLGYIECKDIGTNLDQIERSDQLKRYLPALPNFILTDYLEFRWYREGELCRAERLGRLTPDRSDVKRDSEGVVQVQELLEGFFSAEPIAVGTAQELARYMAAKAKQLRDNAQRVLSQEGELGPLHALHQAFRETLIHDLDADQFADMYAQTLAYGLFSACLRCNNGSSAQYFGGRPV